MNNKANFLALNNRTGIYIADNVKHKIPIAMQIPKAVNRWIRDYEKYNILFFIN